MSALVRETVKQNHTPTAVRVHASVYVLNNSITDHHSDMLNLTSRIAVKMQNLADWDVDWNDSRPQRPRSSLTCSDFLPDDDDATELLKRAVQYVMEFLVSEFNSLKDLKPHVPPRQSPHPVRRTIVAPMEILFKDEKYKSETIDILTELMKDAALTGQPQVNNLYTHVVTTYIHVHVCTFNIHDNVHVYVHVYFHLGYSW